MKYKVRLKNDNLQPNAKVIITDNIMASRGDRKIRFDKMGLFG